MIIEAISFSFHSFELFNISFTIEFFHNTKLNFIDLIIKVIKLLIYEGIYLQIIRYFIKKDIKSYFIATNNEETISNENSISD